MRYRQYKDIYAGKEYRSKLIQTDNSINNEIIRVIRLVHYRLVQRICTKYPRLLLYINCYGVRVFAWMFGESLFGEVPRVPSYVNTSVCPLHNVVAGFVELAGLGGSDRQVLHSGSRIAIKVINGELSR